MNAFLEEIIVLADKLNKEEDPFKCLMIVEEIKKKYRNHIKELMGNSIIEEERGLKVLSKMVLEVIKK